MRRQRQPQQPLSQPDPQQPPKRRLKRITTQQIYDPLSSILTLQDQPITVSTDQMEYEHKCSICLEQVQERARPSTCKHDYCLECIFAWTRHSDVCPLCKVKITQLNQFDPLNPLVVIQQHQVVIQAKEEVSDFVVEFADKCMQCQTVKEDDEESLLVCDNCNFNVVHYQCLGLEQVPEEDDWFCEKCTRESRDMRRLEQTLRRRIRKQRQLAQVEESSEQEECKDVELKGDIYGDDSSSGKVTAEKVCKKTKAIQKPPKMIRKKPVLIQKAPIIMTQKAPSRVNKPKPMLSGSFQPRVGLSKPKVTAKERMQLPKVINGRILAPAPRPFKKPDSPVQMMFNELFKQPMVSKPVAIKPMLDRPLKSCLKK